MPFKDKAAKAAYQKEYQRNNRISNARRSYYCAKQRCNNPNNTAYASYGGRGIEFRFNSFDELHQLLGDRPDGYDLERLNNEGHYEAGNVAWVPHKANARNKRDTRFFTYQGKTQCLMAWCEELEIKYGVLRGRVNRGTPFAEAVKDLA